MSQAIITKSELNNIIEKFLDLYLYYHDNKMDISRLKFIDDFLVQKVKQLTEDKKRLLLEKCYDVLLENKRYVYYRERGRDLDYLLNNIKKELEI